MVSHRVKELAKHEAKKNCKKQGKKKKENRSSFDDYFKLNYSYMLVFIDMLYIFITCPDHQLLSSRPNKDI